jgi:hypothetical protein
MTDAEEQERKARAHARIRDFRLRLLRDSWQALTGHLPTPDEATLLGEALQRHGAIQPALDEVHAAIASGHHPGLMD